MDISFKANVTGHGFDHHNSAYFNLRKALPDFHWRKRTDLTDGFTEFMRNKPVDVGYLQNLRFIEGIEELNVYEAYRLHVKKAEMFTWDELQPVIEQVLQDWIELQPIFDKQKVEITLAS